MDSMEVNKGIAAVLVGGILFFLTGLIGDILVRERLPEKPALKIAAAPAAPSGGEAEAGRACHRSHRCWPAPTRRPARQFAQEGLRRLPYLRQGRQDRRRPEPLRRGRRAARPRAGLQLFGADGEVQAGPLDVSTQLNEWLYKPSAYVPGTRMAFAGITNDKQRADVIAYLRTLSDNPAPLAGRGGGAGAAGGAPPAPAAPKP